MVFWLGLLEGGQPNSEPWPHLSVSGLTGPSGVSLVSDVRLYRILKKSRGTIYEALLLEGGHPRG
jgi:hypothetical protein